MNILRLSFELDPNRATKIMKKINYDDKKISNLLNKLRSDIANENNSLWKAIYF